jgi:hypothetical protein
VTGGDKFSGSLVTPYSREPTRRDRNEGIETQGRRQYAGEIDEALTGY